MRRNQRIWAWAAAFLTGTLLLCSGGWWWLGKEFKGMDDAPHMTKDQIAAFEERYRDKGTTEQAAKGLEAVIAQAANEITALVPGLSWKWQYDSSPLGCPEDARSDTWVMRISTRMAGFDGPIPDAVWLQAMQLAQRKAGEIGANNLITLIDKPGDHDVRIAGSEGQEINISTKVEAYIRGTTACRLREHWYAEHNIPIPTPTTS